MLDLGGGALAGAADALGAAVRARRPAAAARGRQGGARDAARARPARAPAPPRPGAADAGDRARGRGSPRASPAAAAGPEPALARGAPVARARRRPRDPARRRPRVRPGRARRADGPQRRRQVDAAAPPRRPPAADARDRRRPPAASRCCSRTPVTTCCTSTSATRRAPRRSRPSGLVADDRNPRDLSGGERQRLALAIVLDGDDRPAAVLLDEPTRGMDRAAKGVLADRLRALAAERDGACSSRRTTPSSPPPSRERVILLADGRADRRRAGGRGAQRRLAFRDRDRARARRRRRRADARAGRRARARPDERRRSRRDLGRSPRSCCSRSRWGSASPGTSARSRARGCSRSSATLAAFAAIGRIAFAPFPNVKPTTDIVLIAGFALGGAPGFVVGAVAALASNLVFGQGPWTPWQMAAWGLCGVFGAVLGRLSGHRLGRVPLALACGAAGLMFGAIMDFSVWVTYSGAANARPVPGALGHLAAVQHRPRRRQRRLLPRLRPGAPARADALPLAARGPLARPAAPAARRRCSLIAARRGARRGAARAGARERPGGAAQSATAAARAARLPRADPAVQRRLGSGAAHADDATR